MMTLPCPPCPWDTLEKRVAGQEKELFVPFITSMPKWLPEEGRTAKQLLEDPSLL